MPCVRCKGGVWECGPDQTDLCDDVDIDDIKGKPDGWEPQGTMAIDPGIWYVKLECSGCDVRVERVADTLCGWQCVGTLMIDADNAGKYALYSRKRNGECEFRMDPAE